MPRFRMQETLDVTVSRAGATDIVPGRALNVCERGIGAVVAGELAPGEAVGIEIRPSALTRAFKTRAVVRYQDRLRCGLEFAPATAEQETAIREWAKNVVLRPQLKESSTSLLLEEKQQDKVVSEEAPRATGRSGSGGNSRRPRKRTLILWMLVLLAIVITTGAFWWKWNRDWQQLEAGLKTPGTAIAEKPKVQVPAELMQRLLVHRVEPVYPEEARKQNLQGVIALDIVVGREGSVERMRALNGPDILAKAAMDALRWWRFSPYRLNGEPVAVETTVAVEFKR